MRGALSSVGPDDDQAGVDRAGMARDVGGRAVLDRGLDDDTGGAQGFSLGRQRALCQSAQLGDRILIEDIGRVGGRHIEQVKQLQPERRAVC